MFPLSCENLLAIGHHYVGALIFQRGNNTRARNASAACTLAIPGLLSRGRVRQCIIMRRLITHYAPQTLSLALPHSCNVLTREWVRQCDADGELDRGCICGDALSSRSRVAHRAARGRK